MSERGSGMAPFLLGVVIGALAGVLFAPARGDVTRRRIQRRVGDLKDLAEEKYDEFLAEPAEEGQEAETAEEPSTREELERRLREARRRRRIERAARTRRGPREEDDEPVA